MYQWWVFIYLIQLFWLHFFKMGNSFIFWFIVKTSVVSRLNNRSGFFKSLSWVRILISYLYHLQTNVSHAENRNQKFWYPFLNYWSNIDVWSILIIALFIMAPDFKVNINLKKKNLIQYPYIFLRSFRWLLKRWQTTNYEAIL